MKCAASEILPNLAHGELVLTPQQSEPFGHPKATCENNAAIRVRRAFQHECDVPICRDCLARLKQASNTLVAVDALVRREDHIT